MYPQFLIISFDAIFRTVGFNGQLNCSLANKISSNCMFLFIVNLQVHPKEIGKHLERARISTPVRILFSKISKLCCLFGAAAQPCAHVYVCVGGVFLRHMLEVCNSPMKLCKREGGWGFL